MNFPVNDTRRTEEWGGEKTRRGRDEIGDEQDSVGRDFANLALGSLLEQAGMIGREKSVRACPVMHHLSRWGLGSEEQGGSQRRQ